MKNLGKFEVMLMAITLTKSRYRHMDFLPAVAGDGHVIVIKNNLEHDYDFTMYIQVLIYYRHFFCTLEIDIMT